MDVVVNLLKLEVLFLISQILLDECPIRCYLLDGDALSLVLIRCDCIGIKYLQS